MLFIIISKNLCKNTAKILFDQIIDRKMPFLRHIGAALIGPSPRQSVPHAPRSQALWMGSLCYIPSSKARVPHRPVF